MQRNFLLTSLLFIILSMHLMASDGDLPVGLGAFSKGMGGVAIALPQDALIGAVNPAGTGWIGNRTDTVLGYGRYNQRARIRRNTEFCNRTYHSRPDIFLSESGYNLQLTNCLSAGLTLWLRGNEVNYGRTVEVLGRKKLTGGFLRYVFTPTLAWNINCNHTIGLGINISSARFRMKGLENLKDFSKVPDHVTKNTARGETGISVTLGWIGQLTPCLSAGVTYETETFYSRLRKFRGFLPNRGNVNLPQKVGAGLAYRMGCWVIASDMYGIFWKDTKFFGNKGFNHNHHLFGSRKGPGLGWKNQFIYKLGIAYDWSCNLTLRTGISLGSRLISSRETFSNIPFNLIAKNHWTCGATWVRGCHDFTAAFVYGFAKEIKGKGHSIPCEFGGGKANLKASSYLFALGYGYAF